MIQILNNPNLNYDAIEPLIMKDTIIAVSPQLLKTAKEIMDSLIMRYRGKNQMDSCETAKYFKNFFIRVCKNFTKFEWMVVNNDNIYYSQGTGQEK